MGVIEIRRVAVLAVLASCALAFGAPAPASARFSDRDAARSLEVAWRYWHSLRPAIFEREGYHCNRGEVELVWMRSMGPAMARAELWGCRLDPPELMLEEATIRSLGDVHACGVVTHEFGHLLGYRHVSNPDHVMSGEPSEGERPPRRATWRRAWRRCRRGL